MTLIFPLLSFLSGVLLSKISMQQKIRTVLSTLLAKLLIPVVIIYNMVFYQPGHLTLIVVSILAAIFLYITYLVLFKDRLQALCFSYSNIGWLGLPIAMAIFGVEVSGIMIALYIGGSLFGNVWAVSAVSNTPQSVSNMLKKLLFSPPVIALCLAALLRVFHLHEMKMHDTIDVLYTLAKWAMSFAGMCVLGMWLSQTNVTLHDLILGTKSALFKLLCGLVFCAVLYQFVEVKAIHDALAIIFLLFCLPPAANIVALETHYQGTGLSAKYIAAGTIVSCALILIYAGLGQLYWF